MPFCGMKMLLLRIHGSSSEFMAVKEKYLGPTMGFSFLISACHRGKDLLYPTHLLVYTAD